MFGLLSMCFNGRHSYCWWYCCYIVHCNLETASAGKGPYLGAVPIDKVPKHTGEKIVAVCWPGMAVLLDLIMCCFYIEFLLQSVSVCCACSVTGADKYWLRMCICVLLKTVCNTHKYILKIGSFSFRKLFLL